MLRTDQPVGLGVKAQRFTHRPVPGQGQGEEQQGPAGIAIVGQGADRDDLRSRPARRPDGDAVGEGPGEARRITRVAGVAPVGVPAGLDLENQGEIDRLAGRDGGPLRHHARSDMLGRDRVGQGQPRPGEQGEQ